MAEPGTGGRRRVLVAVDEPASSERLADLAARLAAARRAELLGLYVEDSAFLQAAALPFGRTLRLQGGTWEAADPERMALALRARARELETALTQVAARWSVACSFRREQGPAGERLARVAGEAELAILARSRRGRGAVLGRTARRTARESRASVLLLDPEAQAPGRVTAFYQGDAAVLAAGAELADLFARPLDVLVCADGHGPPERLRADAEAWLRQHGRPARVRALGACDAGTLAGELAGQPPGLVVVGAEASVAGLDLARLLDLIAGPILILRAGVART